MQRVLLLLVVVAFIPRAAEAQGEPIGPEFRVNTYTTNDQEHPAVASDASGIFVVVWQSFLQVGVAWDVFGQRFASTGAPIGPEFRVNTSIAEHQKHPAVASEASGKFVVVVQLRPALRLRVRRLRPALRQYRRAPWPPVPRQHAHEE